MWWVFELMGAGIGIAVCSERGLQWIFWVLCVCCLGTSGLCCDGALGDATRSRFATF